MCAHADEAKENRVVLDDGHLAKQGFQKTNQVLAPAFHKVGVEMVGHPFEVGRWEVRHL